MYNYQIDSIRGYVIQFFQTLISWYSMINDHWKNMKIEAFVFVCYSDVFQSADVKLSHLNKYFYPKDIVMVK